MTAMLRAFHGDPAIKAIKAKYLARLADHRAADQLIRGVGWEHGQGCAVGCTLDAYDHGRYPVELGIPVALAYAEDHIFESLPSDLAMAWPQRFLDAIPVGADLSLVIDRLMRWTLDYDLRAPINYPEGIARHQALIALYDRRLAGHEPREEEWLGIEEAARDARAARAAWDAWDAFCLALADELIRLLETAPQ